MAEVVFVNNLITNNQLIIPPYQRPYKWTKKIYRRIAHRYVYSIN